MDKILDLVTDPYERKARATPALLTVLPIVVPLVCQFGAKNPILTAIVGLLGTCGSIYAGASIARGRGKLVETVLVEVWGGMPTTILLRHRDDFFDSETKKRYHLDAQSRLGITMPTEAQEAADPKKADDAYGAVARRLRELTRTDKGLLFKENIAYGFHRNMLGIKPIGALFSVLGILYGLILAGAIKLDPPSFDLHSLASPGLSGGLSCLVSLVMLAIWLFYFNPRQVRVIGNVYAERLLEKLPQQRKLPGTKVPTAAAPTVSSPTDGAEPAADGS